MNILDNRIIFENYGLDVSCFFINYKPLYADIFNIIKIGQLNNITGRIYNEDAVLKIIEDFYNKCTYFYGTIDINSRVNRCTSLNMSHVVNDLWIENETLKANITIVDTYNGRRLLKLIKSNKISFSTACFGEVNDDKTVNIFDLITIYARRKDDVGFIF